MALTIWAKTGTYRCLRTEPAGSGTTVSLTQARHERRSLQILARATGTVNNLDIATTALTDGNGNTIAASNLVVYRAHQIEIVQETYRNDNDTDSSGTLDWYPNALIPTVHPVTGTAISAGYTYQALPYTLPANQTHTFLVDVYVPKAAEAGEYTATITVSADGQSDVEIVLTLTVRPWALPDAPALLTLFAAPAVRLAADMGWSLSDSDWVDAVAVCNTVMSEARLSAISKNVSDRYFRPEGSGNSWSYPADEVEPLQTHIDTFHPNVYQVATGSIISTWGIGAYDEDNLVAYIAAMEEGLAVVNRPETRFLIYIGDEPWSSGADTWVNQWGPVVHDSTIDSLVATTVVPVHGETINDGVVNIWAVGTKFYDGLEPAADAVRLAAGDDVWWYNVLSGSTVDGTRPWWAIDRDPLNYQVLPWMLWKEGMTGLEYWSALWVKEIMKAGGDPWTEPCTYMTADGEGRVAVELGNSTITFSDQDGADRIGLYIGIEYETNKPAVYRIVMDGLTGTLATNYQEATNPAAVFRYLPFMGEALLAYPCTEAEVGFNGIVPSMRLMAVRDGVQDYDYFALAEACGIGDDADTEVNALITTISDGDWSWNSNPDAYDAARERIGDLLDALMARPSQFYYHQTLAI